MTIKDRIYDRLVSIARDIKECAQTCEAMQKKKLISTFLPTSCLYRSDTILLAKIFKSIVWEGKLKDFAAAFIAHRDALREDLAMHTSLAVEANSEKLNVMLLFRQLQAPAERDLWKFVERKGGPERFLEDDSLMDELRARAPPSAEEEDVGRAELVGEFKMTVTDLLQANEAVFSRKFEAQQTALADEMENRMIREGDRIIRALKVGAAYERLIDPVSPSASRSSGRGCS